MLKNVAFDSAATALAFGREVEAVITLLMLTKGLYSQILYTV